MSPPDPAPRVSVIMPLYNVVPFLAETLASLRAQAWPALELIAVDDGSTDGTPELFAQLQPEAILVRQANRGPSAARNAALALATGDYIAFLDADDLWPPGKLARQVARLEADLSLDASLGFIRLFTDAPAGRQWGRPFFLFLLGGMVARRRLFSTAGGVGGFDVARFPYNGEDTDWFFRAWESGRALEIREEPEIFYRRRPGSLASSSDDTKRAFPSIVMTSLRRRRGPDGRTVPLPDTLRLPAHLPASG
jgi:glycosyltransferase involved in cell wall biosynthesis